MSGEQNPTPPAPPTPANMPPKANQPLAPAPKDEPIRLPDDHPLVRALEAQKTLNRDLKAKIENVTNEKANQDAGLQQQINDLTAMLTAEKQTREEAERKAAQSAVASLRAERISQHQLSPAAAAKLAQVLVSTEADKIDAEIQEWLPILAPSGGSGVPLPNPQQGTPPGAKAGSVSSGRERYKERVGAK